MNDKRRAVERIAQNGDVVAVYDSVLAAARANYMSTTAVTMRCDGKIKHPFRPDGYSFRWRADAQASGKGAPEHGTDGYLAERVRDLEATVEGLQEVDRFMRAYLAAVLAAVGCTDADNGVEVDIKTVCTHPDAFEVVGIPVEGLRVRLFAMEKSK